METKLYGCQMTSESINDSLITKKQNSDQKEKVTFNKTPWRRPQLADEPKTREDGPNTKLPNNHA